MSEGKASLPKIGIVLAGGMSKVAYEIGCLQAILEHFEKEQIVAISTSSIGTLAGYACSTEKLPEMAEKNLTLDFNEIKLKSSDFMEGVRRSNPKYEPKTENDLKSELLAENLRLLYVAITRAKRKLVVTVSRKSKSFEKTVDQTPSLIFSELLGGIDE